MICGRLPTLNAACYEEPHIKQQALIIQLGHELVQCGAWAVVKLEYMGKMHA